MSILLQNAATAKFVEGPTSWTDRPDVAMHFNGSSEALLYCYEHHLRNMRILGRFDDPRKNFAISIEESAEE